jgi:hypothetical protein
MPAAGYAGGVVGRLSSRTQPTVCHRLPPAAGSSGRAGSAGLSRHADPTGARDDHARMEGGSGFAAHLGPTGSRSPDGHPGQGTSGSPGHGGHPGSMSPSWSGPDPCWGTTGVCGIRVRGSVVARSTCRGRPPVRASGCAARTVELCRTGRTVAGTVRVRRAGRQDHRHRHRHQSAVSVTRQRARACRREDRPRESADATSLK